MIEKFKTGLLTVLVILSLGQSYLLAYSMPGLGATTPRRRITLRALSRWGRKNK